MFIEHLPQLLHTKFRFIWLRSFRGEVIFFKSANQKQESLVATMFVNGSGRNEYSLQRAFHRCFLLSLVEAFQWRRLKCEQLMDDRRRTKDDGRRAPSDGKSSHCLWQGELTTVIGQICRSTQTHYSDSEPTSLCFFSLMLRSQPRSNKYQFYILLTRPRLVPTIYRTRGEHANALEASTLTITLPMRFPIFI